MAPLHALEISVFCTLIRVISCVAPANSFEICFVRWRIFFHVASTVKLRARVTFSADRKTEYPYSTSSSNVTAL